MLARRRERHVVGRRDRHFERRIGRERALLKGCKRALKVVCTRTNNEPFAHAFLVETFERWKPVEREIDFRYATLRAKAFQTALEAEGQMTLTTEAKQGCLETEARDNARRLDCLAA